MDQKKIEHLKRLKERNETWQEIQRIMGLAGEKNRAAEEIITRARLERLIVLHKKSKRKD